MSNLMLTATLLSHLLLAIAGAQGQSSAESSLRESCWVRPQANCEEIGSPSFVFCQDTTAGLRALARENRLTRRKLSPGMVPSWSSTSACPVSTCKRHG